ncbi:MAG: flagellar hook-length control protein FliK [Pseudomonadota bacterium]
MTGLTDIDVLAPKPPLQAPPRDTIARSDRGGRAFEETLEKLSKQDQTDPDAELTVSAEAKTDSDITVTIEGAAQTTDFDAKAATADATLRAQQTELAASATSEPAGTRLEGEVSNEAAFDVSRNSADGRVSDTVDGRGRDTADKTLPPPNDIQQLADANTKDAPIERPEASVEVDPGKDPKPAALSASDTPTLETGELAKAADADSRASAQQVRVEAADGVATSEAQKQAAVESAADIRAATDKADAKSASAEPKLSADAQSVNPSSAQAQLVAGGETRSAGELATAAPITTSSSAPAALSPLTTPQALQAQQQAVLIASPSDVPDIVSKVQAQGSEDGDQRVLVRLDPPELGKVSIDFKFDAQGLQHVTITAETPEAIKRLRELHFELVQGLEQSGLSGQDMTFRQETPNQNPSIAQLAVEASEEAGADSAGPQTQTVLETLSGAAAHRDASGRLNIRL